MAMWLVEDEESLNERVEDVLFAAAARLAPISNARARFNPQDVHKDIRLKYDLMAAVKVRHQRETGCR
jgi:hypothetical protein